MTQSEEELVSILEKIPADETEKNNLIQLIKDFGINEKLASTVEAWLSSVEQAQEVAYKTALDELYTELEKEMDEVDEDARLLTERLKAMVESSQKQNDDKQIDAIRRQIGT